MSAWSSAWGVPLRVQGERERRARRGVAWRGARGWCPRRPTHARQAVGEAQGGQGVQVKAVQVSVSLPESRKEASWAVPHRRRVARANATSTPRGAALRGGQERQGNAQSLEKLSPIFARLFRAGRVQTAVRKEHNRN